MTEPMPDLWTLLAAVLIGAAGGAYVAAKFMVGFVMDRAYPAAIAAGADEKAYLEQLSFQFRVFDRYRADRKKAIAAARARLKAGIEEEAKEA